MMRADSRVWPADFHKERRPNENSYERNCRQKGWQEEEVIYATMLRLRRRFRYRPSQPRSPKSCQPHSLEPYADFAPIALSWRSAEYSPRSCFLLPGACGCSTRGRKWAFWVFIGTQVYQHRHLNAPPTMTSSFACPIPSFSRTLRVRTISRELAVGAVYDQSFPRQKERLRRQQS